MHHFDLFSHKTKAIKIILILKAGQEDYDRLRPLSYPQVSILEICFRFKPVESIDTFVILKDKRVFSMLQCNKSEHIHECR
jgi:hypothetical protein